MVGFKIFLCVFVFAIIHCVLAHAEIYKWVDDRGVEHFSNAPPPAHEAISEFEILSEYSIESSPVDNYEFKKRDEPSQVYPEIAQHHTEINQDVNESFKITPGDAVDAELRSLWNNMVSCLSREDIDGAAAYMHPKTRSKYKIMTEAIKSKLPHIVSTAVELQYEHSWGHENGYCEAVYKLSTIENGQKYAYPVKFVRERDGNWWIYDF